MPNSFDFNRYEDWKSFMNHSIYAALIALKAHDFVRSGNGYPTEHDMQKICEEAAALSNLWSKVTPQ